MRSAGSCELTLETRDMPLLERFYAGVFGLEVLAREDDRVWLTSGDRARLRLLSPGAQEFGGRCGRHVHFAFSAAPGRLPEIANRARAAGAPVNGPVEH